MTPHILWLLWPAPVLLFAAVTDGRYRYIHPAVILALIAMADLLSGLPVFPTYLERVAGCLLCSVPLLVVSLKREGICGGDIKLLFGVGAYFGIYALPIMLGIATLTGLGWCIFTKHKSVPLAVFLAIGYAFFIGIELIKEVIP